MVAVPVPAEVSSQNVLIHHFKQTNKMSDALLWKFPIREPVNAEYLRLQPWPDRTPMPVAYLWSALYNLCYGKPEARHAARFVSLSLLSLKI